MALTSDFQRLPYNHGDLNTYHDAVMRMLLAGGIGGLSIEASNVGGVLTVSQGFGGIYDGTLAGKGAIQVTTTGSVSTAAGTAGLWHALEYSVSGTSVTWYLTSLAGETDESFMSLTMKGYYDGSKSGYYRIASRRIVAFVFLRAALALGRIVNCENGKLGFRNIRYVDYDTAGVSSKKYYAILKVNVPAWNMDTTGVITINLPFMLVQKISKIIAVMYNNALTFSSVLYPEETAWHSVQVYGAIGLLTLVRPVGGLFDASGWTAATGIVEIEFET